MKASFRALLGATTTLALFPLTAHAQSTPASSPAPATDAAATPGAPEIIVTATRRATSLQRVPATVEVAQAAKLTTLEINSAEGIGTIVPGVTVTRSGGVTPFIRGIGTLNAGFSEASVAQYVDGVYLPNSAASLFSFNNIDRIEVLKGPQGTLYGRNTTGGLINVVTRAPGDHTTVDASLGYGNYNTFTQNFYGSTPLTDNLAANVAVYHQKQADGWSRNLATGHDVQKSEDTGVYGKLQWKPGANTKITLSNLYSRSNSSKGWMFAIMPGTYGTDGTPYLGKYTSSTSIDPGAIYHGDMTALRIDQDLGFANMFSLTSYQAGAQSSQLVQNGIVGQPVAGRSAQLLAINFNYKTFSQEFNLSSKPSASPFSWLLGAFIYSDNTDIHTDLWQTCVGTSCAPGVPSETHVRPTTRSYSGYADGTYNATSSTHLTVGLRYTYETKGFWGVVTPLQGLPNSAASLPASVVTSTQAAGLPASVNYPKLTYRAVIAQDFSNTIHGYASYNRGFKSGNYNPNSVTNQPVRPEILDSYEVGVKSELFNRSLRANVSGFYYNYKDIQVRSIAGLPSGSLAIAQNAAEAHIKGIDAQFDWTPVRNLSFNAGMEYLEAKYVSYPGATLTYPLVPTGSVLGGVGSVGINLAGYTLPLAPKFSMNLGMTYKINTPIGPFTFVANDDYKSTYYFAPDDSMSQRSRHLVDLSLTYASQNGRYDVRFSVKNVGNLYTYAAAQNGSTYAYVPAAPRTYGVTVGVHL
ncbi:TonB-dependent receptor [Novosphingobium terrae]|uniref:TonB-dependent receptor n=1 Tax=Novosphingobium terrae TaxID=2726189 RepID=UPI0019822F5F|nr:TonB-dependent receptor [Novosphingobium terrae]